MDCKGICFCFYFQSFCNNKTHKGQDVELVFCPSYDSRDEASLNGSITEVEGFENGINNL